MSDNDSPIKHLKQKWLCYNLIPGQTYIWHFSGGLHFKLVEANGGYRISKCIDHTLVASSLVQACEKSLKSLQSRNKDQATKV